MFQKKLNSRFKRLGFSVYKLHFTDLGCSLFLVNMFKVVIIKEALITIIYTILQKQSLQRREEMSRGIEGIEVCRQVEKAKQWA